MTDFDILHARLRLLVLIALANYILTFILVLVVALSLLIK